MDMGWIFEVRWKDTSLRENVRASSREQAERKIRRRYKTAVGYDFVGMVAEFPAATWSERWRYRYRLGRKVF
jgi:hypothetical protein